MDRNAAATKNIISGLISKLVSFGLNFASRTVFIYVLGKQFLGVNGLYTEILTVLSFAELGFGTALTFAMYKPVAEGDENKTLKLIRFYKRIYQVIAILVALIGVSLTPFLQYLVRGADQITLNELRIYFLIFLSNTVISYFVMYRYSYINARQENYYTTIFDMIVTVVVVLAQIVGLLVFRNYLAYLLIHMGFLIVSKLVFSFLSTKRYSIFRKKAKEKLSKEEKAPIYREVRGLVVHQFSNIAIHSTDSIIISSVASLGVSVVGIVANYNTLMTSVLGFIAIVFTSISSGMGNLFATSSKQRFYEVFKELNFINFWFYGFSSIAFICLVPPFISLWLGDEYILEFLPFLLIVINGYFEGQSTIYNTARLACGNFQLDKWISLSQAIINLVLSIILANIIGLVGIYVGTIVSRLFFVVFRPLVTFKFMFERSPSDYYSYLLKYSIVAALVGCFCYFLVQNCFSGGITVTRFVIASLLVLVVPNAVFLALFSNTKEFVAAKERLGRLLARFSKTRSENPQ